MYIGCRAHLKSVQPTEVRVDACIYGHVTSQWHIIAVTPTLLSFPVAHAPSLQCMFTPLSLEPQCAFYLHASAMNDILLLSFKTRVDFFTGAGDRVSEVQQEINICFLKTIVMVFVTCFLE